MSLGVLRKSEGEQPTIEAEKSSSRDSVVAVGDVAAGVLKRVPLSLAVNLESVEAVAHLERRAKWANHSVNLSWILVELWLSLMNFLLVGMSK